jgi:hypothetical protein
MQISIVMQILLKCLSNNFMTVKYSYYEKEFAKQIHFKFWSMEVS